MPAGGRGVRRGPQGCRADAGPGRPPDRRRQPRPRQSRLRGPAGVRQDALAGDLTAADRQPRHGPARRRAGRRARSGRAGRDDRCSSCSPTGPPRRCWRATAELADHRLRSASPPRSPRATTRCRTPFLSWQGFLDREPPRRPDPAAPAAPPSLRSDAVEVRVRRLAVRSVRHASSAAGAGVPCIATASTRWRPCRWPMSRPRSPPSPSTGWPSRPARR